MAFGIDDALVAAASAIKLADTLTKTIEKYRKEDEDIDIERLIEEVRITTVSGINEADQALLQFERTLIDRKMDLNKSISQIMSETSRWHPFEQHRLKQIRRQLNTFADAVYMATDDIAALARCRDKTRPMGEAVVESTRTKHAFNEAFNNATSIRGTIKLLRDELAKQKASLSR